MTDNQEHEGHFFKGLVYGVALGVGLVWLLGTKEGKRVKEDLLERGQNLLEKAESKLEDKLIENSEPPKE